MKQTAVEIVENKIEAEAIALFDGELTFNEFMDNISKYFNQAKEMEKDNTKKLLEIIMWYDEQSDVRPNTEIYTWFQQYYNETFKSE